jgi:sporadic carbohydrate cluster 2OG-Fe(II) oxygenase
MTAMGGEAAAVSKQGDAETKAPGRSRCAAALFPVRERGDIRPPGFGDREGIAPPPSSAITGTAMHVINSFVRPEEQALAEEFAANGYVVRPVDDREALDELRRFVAQTVCDQLKIELPNDIDDFLNHVERVMPIEKLNEVRLNTYRKMNAALWFRPTYFGLARSVIETLVGNELAMQNRINLSIQLPRDDSSLLAIHADAFGGETPFQVVEWLPLVDCHKTKSMFILPRAKSEAVYAAFTRYEGKGMDQLYKDVEKDVIWCNVPYGHVLVFSPNYLHGGVINDEPETRWSMNCRFTGLFTPYTGAEKKLGSYYLPITTRPVTRMALQYREPSGFKE